MTSTGHAGDGGAPRWDLSGLYRDIDDPALEGDLTALRQRADSLGAAYRGRIASLSAAELAGAIARFEEVFAAGYRAAAYGFLEYATRTDDEAVRALKSRIGEQTTGIENALRFLDVEIKTAPDATVAAWLADPALARYAHHVRKLRSFAPHTLGEREESLLAIKDLTGRQAWAQLYTEVTSAFSFDLEADGETRTRTLAEARALRSHPDRDVRRNAQTAVLSRFEKHEQVLTFALDQLYQDHRLEIRERGYTIPAEPTFLDDELDAETVGVLMSSVEAAYPIAQRYYSLKARVLGLPDFASYDVLAPLAKAERRIAWSDGRRLVEQSFAALGDRFSGLASYFFDARRIDAEPRPGKRDGAFCSGMVPGVRPFVFANYTGRIDDVSTIAHELGHAIHFALAGERQTLVNYWPTTPMAETASVFGEMVLVRDLLSREKDPAVRRQILASRIEDIIGTVLRQVAYTRWEMNAHAARAEGQLSADALSAMWSKEMGRLYGDAVKRSPIERWGWITIPHLFHYRFYCYSYAFGMLLVFALYKSWQRDQDEGRSEFVPRYEALLASGGSDSPQRLLAPLGIDIRARDFWSRGLEVFGELVDELEKTV